MSTTEQPEKVGPSSWETPLSNPTGALRGDQKRVGRPPGGAKTEPAFKPGPAENGKRPTGDGELVFGVKPAPLVAKRYNLTGDRLRVVVTKPNTDARVRVMASQSGGNNLAREIAENMVLDASIFNGVFEAEAIKTSLGYEVWVRFVPNASE